MNKRLKLVGSSLYDALKDRSFDLAKIFFSHRLWLKVWVTSNMFHVQNNIRSAFQRREFI